MSIVLKIVPQCQYVLHTVTHLHCYHKTGMVGVMVILSKDLFPSVPGLATQSFIILYSLLEISAENLIVTVSAKALHGSILYIVPCKGIYNTHGFIYLQLFYNTM